MMFRNKKIRAGLATAIMVAKTKPMEIFGVEREIENTFFLSGDL